MFTYHREFSEPQQGSYRSSAAGFATVFETRASGFVPPAFLFLAPVV